MNKDFALAGAGAAVVLVVAAVVIGRKAGQVAATKLNPLSPENIAYSSANALGAAVSGDEKFNLGSRLWEWLHPGQVEAEKRAVGMGMEYGEQTPLDNVTDIDKNVAAASSLPVTPVFKPRRYYDLGAKPAPRTIDAGSGYENSPAQFGNSPNAAGEKSSPWERWFGT